jgi:histone H3/H4
MTAKLPLAPIKRIAVEGGAQRIGIPAAEIIGLAAEEWIKRITLAAEKYAIHAGRKTVKPEDIAVVVKDMGITIQINSPKPKHKVKKVVPVEVAPRPPLPPFPPTPTPAPMIEDMPLKPTVPIQTHISANTKPLPI